MWKLLAHEKATLKQYNRLKRAANLTTPAVKIMTLSHEQRYPCGIWSTCAPHWLYVAAPCDVEAPGTRGATLQQTTGATQCNPHDAFNRATAATLKDQWWNDWQSHFQLYTCVTGQLVHLTSTASHHPAMWKLPQHWCCWHFKSRLQNVDHPLPSRPVMVYTVLSGRLIPT